MVGKIENDCINRKKELTNGESVMSSGASVLATLP